MQRQEYLVAVGIGFVIGAAAVWMWRRNKQNVAQNLAQNPIQYPQLALPAGNYHNAETWDIKWNADGTLPERVTVTRDAHRT